jgi:hypothetical protein
MRRTTTASGMRRSKLAIDRGWLWKHESGTYVKLTQAGADHCNCAGCQIRQHQAFSHELNQLTIGPQCVALKWTRPTVAANKAT